jgi:hypothetical protein
MLYLIGEFASNGSFGMAFNEQAERHFRFWRKEMSESFVSCIAVCDRRKKKLYVGLFGRYLGIRGLRYVRFKPEKAHLYVVFGSSEKDDRFFDIKDTTKDTSCFFKEDDFRVNNSEVHLNIPEEKNP